MDVVTAREYAQIHRITLRQVWRRVARGLGPQPVERGHPGGRGSWPTYFDKGEVIAAAEISHERGWDATTLDEYRNLPPLITAQEYAQIHRITVRAVRKRYRAGRGPLPTKRGRPTLFDRDEVLRAAGIDPRHGMASAGGS